MNIDLVIAQLRASAAFFGGRVGGAARFEKAVETQTWMQLPAAYVVPLDEVAGPNSSLAGLQQIITERVGVIIALDNSQDRRGQVSSEQLHVARASIFTAILNWRPDVDGVTGATPPATPDSYEARGLAYDGGHLLYMDRARLFYQFDFALETTVTDYDGWQPLGVPLVEVALDTTFLASGMTSPESLNIAVSIPQSIQAEAGPELMDEQGNPLLSDNPPAPYAP